MTMPRPEKLLTSGEVEDILGVGRGWCAKDRITKAQLPFVKIGAACRYRPSDVRALINDSVRRSTSDAGNIEALTAAKLNDEHTSADLPRASARGTNLEVTSTLRQSRRRRASDPGEPQAA